MRRSLRTIAAATIALALCLPAEAAAQRKRSSSKTTTSSTSVARARSAPTVAWSRLVCWNGSQSKKRQAFSQVILWISSAEQPASWNSFQANSGDSGHVVSVWG